MTAKETATRCRPPASAFLLLATAAGAQVLPAATPEALAVPRDQPAMTLSATGVPIDECRAGTAGGPPAWAFREP